MWTDNVDHHDRDDGHSCHDYVGLAQARPNYTCTCLNDIVCSFPHAAVWWALHCTGLSTHLGAVDEVA